MTHGFPTQIHTTIAKCGQDVLGTRLIRMPQSSYRDDIPGEVVKLEIRSNSADFQSHAIASVWSRSDMRWNDVCSIPYSKMATPPGLCYVNDNPEKMERFEEDFAELTRVAAMVLNF